MSGFQRAITSPHKKSRVQGSLLGLGSAVPPWIAVTTASRVCDGKGKSRFAFFLARAVIIPDGSFIYLCRAGLTGANTQHLDSKGPLTGTTCSKRALCIRGMRFCYVKAAPAAPSPGGIKLLAPLSRR